MIEFEKVCLQYKPDLVLVVGDVNSTVACSLVASKLWIPVAHVEAGLRSFDRQMPEEINRLVTDALSDYLFITEKSGRENLLKEGIAENKIHFVGNCMIDSLVGLMEKAEQSDIMEKLKITERQFLLVTLHRPSNVDELENFSKIFEALEQIQKTVKTVFPIHPRTKKNIKTFGLEKKVKALKNLLLTEPLGYLDFIKLEKYCTFVLTDSGGLQEESTYMGVPCLTVRKNTERPITVELGTNEVVGLDTRKIIDSAQQILSGKWKKGEIPPLWDGRAAERIVNILARK
jgi:UDP-N-acetylglucosamine 2-epimerase (non-hydrolysing)